MQLNVELIFVIFRCSAHLHAPALNACVLQLIAQMTKLHLLPWLCHSLLCGLCSPFHHHVAERDGASYLRPAVIISCVFVPVFSYFSLLFGPFFVAESILFMQTPTQIQNNYKIRIQSNRSWSAAPPFHS